MELRYHGVAVPQGVGVRWSRKGEGYAVVAEQVAACGLMERMRWVESMVC